MARLTMGVPGADPNTPTHRSATLVDLMGATPALAVYVMPNSTVAVWVNPQVADRVDTEDCERMAVLVLKVLLDCVRLQG
jgi:hypothetical protein